MPLKRARLSPSRGWQLLYQAKAQRDDQNFATGLMVDVPAMMQADFRPGEVLKRRGPERNDAWRVHGATSARARCAGRVADSPDPGAVRWWPAAVRGSCRRASSWRSFG